MQNYSTTITALIVILLGWFQVGNIIGQEEVSAVVNALCEIGGVVYLWYKRWKVGDINALGFRKQ